MSNWTPELGGFPSTIHPLNQAPWMWEAEYDPGVMAQEDLRAISQQDNTELVALSDDALESELQRRQDELLTIGALLTEDRKSLREQQKQTADETGSPVQLASLDITEIYDYQMGNDRVDRAHAELLRRNPDFRVKPLR